MNAEERRQLIVRACVEAVAECGYAATSIREIAGRAGISVGTLLHHFPTKGDILAAAIEDVALTWNRGQAEILEGDGSPLERLRRLVEWLLGDPEYDYLWRVYMAFWNESVFDDGREADLRAANEEWDGRLAACVQEAIDAGALADGDATQIGQALTTLVEGVAIQVHGRLGRWDRDRGVRHCLAFLDSHRPAVAADAGAERAKAVVRELVDAWNSHDVERIAAYFHEDFENWQAPLPTVRGLPAYRAHLEHWFGAYPDLHLDIVTLIAEGDVVCLETSASGSASGAFFDANPPGGTGVNRALDLLVLRDGKVWRERGYWDFSLFAGEPSPLARSGST